MQRKTKNNNDFLIKQQKKKTGEKRVGRCTFFEDQKNES